jgi:hypothetical protein
MAVDGIAAATAASDNGAQGVGGFGGRGGGGSGGNGGGGSKQRLADRERELKDELRSVRELRMKQGGGDGSGAGGGGASGVMAQVGVLQRRAAELREQQKADEQRRKEDFVVGQRRERAEQNELK